MNKSKLKTYAVSILIALAVGGLSALFTNMGMENYKMAHKPALTPPEIVFPIVWTVLFVFMGISSARIWLAPFSRFKNQGLILYGLQLFFNFVWSLLFFNLQAYGFAFFWLVILWLLILLMILSFWKTDRPAAVLQIPYLLWVTFAGYLNLMIAILN